MSRPAEAAAAPRSRPSRADDQQAVSTVLGAVLMFGLLITTLVVVQLEFVPVWDEERESNHMDDLLGELVVMKSDMDRQVGNVSAIAIADRLSLERAAGFRFFQTQRLPAELDFVGPTTGTGVEIAADSLTILELDGRELAALGEAGSWVPLDGSDDEYEDVVGLRVLRVQIPWPAAPNTCDTDKIAVLHVEDADGDELAKANLICHDGQGERTIRTEVYRRDTEAEAFEQVTSDTEAIFQNADADYFYADLLDPALLFDVVLESLEAPLFLWMEDLGLDASYILVFDDASGATSGGGGVVAGQTISPYPATPTAYEGGSLVVTADNTRFPDQTYVLEHGAVLRVQGGTAVVAVAPRFDVVPTATQTIVEWDLPSLQGPSRSLAGAGSATVLLDRAATGLQMRATTAQLVLTIPTAYPAAWGAYLGQEFAEADLTDPGEFELDVLSDAVVVTIHGTSSSATTNDVFLAFTQADIGIDIRTLG
jgi:hypothetical protein